MATNPTIPITLTNGTDNDADEVMTNFDAIKDWVNTNVIHLDGSKAMTGTLSGPGADPVSANEYSRKAYVDAGDITEARYGASVSRAAVLTLASLATSYISFDTEVFDTNGFFTAPSVSVVIPTGGDGLYLVNATVTPSASGLHEASLRLNAVDCAALCIGSNAAGVSSYVVQTVVVCAATDILGVVVKNTSGVSVDFTGSLLAVRICL